MVALGYGQLLKARFPARHHDASGIVVIQKHRDNAKGA
jgi:hypothetical protein